MASTSWISRFTHKKLTTKRSTVVLCIISILLVAWLGIPPIIAEMFARRVVSDGARLLATGEGVIAQINQENSKDPPDFVALTADHQKQLAAHLAAATQLFKTRVKAQRLLDKPDLLILRGKSGSSEWVVVIGWADVIGVCIDGEWRTTRTRDDKLYDAMRDIVTRALPRNH